MALQRLKEAAEKAKCELSTTQETSVNLPFITATQEGPSTCRSPHPGAHGGTVRRPVRAHARAGHQGLGGRQAHPEEVDEVVMVGGMTACPRCNRWRGTSSRQGTQ